MRSERKMDFKIKKYQKVRKRVFERDDFTCQGCGWRPNKIPEDYDGSYAIYSYREWPKALFLDHIKPLSKNGSNVPRNLQVLCFSYNSSKRNKNDRIFKSSKKNLEQQDISATQ